MYISARLIRVKNQASLGSVLSKQFVLLVIHGFLPKVRVINKNKLVVSGSLLLSFKQWTVG